METTSPDTVNYYLRFGWKLVTQHTVPATEDSPEKTCYVLASIGGLEDTRRLLVLTDFAEANRYLELGWRLVEKFVTTDDDQRRQERIHFVLAWQRDEEPPTPTGDPPRLVREHITHFESGEEISVEP